jgi:glucokinase
MILTGDIGATNTRLAFVANEGGRLSIVHHDTYPSADYHSLEQILQAFIAAQHEAPISYACFGVPGPVKNGRCETTNLPWVVDAHSLAQQLHIDAVTVINDLEATAYGVTLLPSSDLVTLHAGAADAVGNAAVIAAGTGLGEAGLFWDGRDYQPFASEGGHTDFAPRDELEIELLRYLITRFGHVSYERLLSGPGLYNIYQFLRDTGRETEPDWLAEELSTQPAPQVISQAALEGRSALCGHALHLFTSIYGAEAGNLALKVMATGGIFLAGGIAPSILPALQAPAFLTAFFAKGRMRPVLEAIPVRVVCNEQVALFGAARCALRQTD